MGDLVRLHKSYFHEFLGEIARAYDEDRLEDFICIYSSKYPAGKEVEGFVSIVGKYWFSGDNGSTVHSLGLVEVMRDEILRYMREYNDAADVGGEI